MPSFSTSVPHNLGKEAASKRLKRFMEAVRARYKDQVSNLEETWRDDALDFSFKTYGFKISGTVEVEEEQVKLDGKLPLAAVAFKGKIEQSINDELTKILS